MISRSLVAIAAFWEEDLICLDCGTHGPEEEFEEGTCPVCASTTLVNPADAMVVLENTEDGA